MTRVMNDAPPPPTLDSGMAVRLRENSICFWYLMKKKILTTVKSRAWKSIRNKNLLLFITIIIINIVVVHLYS